MPRSPRPQCSILLALGLFIPQAASAGDKTAIKNNLIPGHFTQHRISRVIHRKVQKQGAVEELIYRQSGDWVQLNVNEPKPGGVRSFQMMVDRPAKVVSLFDGPRKVSPTPPPEYFGLSRGNTRLHTLERKPREAPVLLPLCDPAESAVLATLLDFAYWKPSAVSPGEKWAHDVNSPDFKGSQEMEYIELLKARDETALVLTMYVTGQFKGDLDKNYTFKKGQAIIHWARMDRTLLKLEARAEYTRKRPNGDEDYVMELNVDLRKTKSYDIDQLDDQVEQLIWFDRANRAKSTGDKAVARRISAEFRRRWPGSNWTPAFDELERAMNPAADRPRELKSSELSRLLGESLIKWEAAINGRDYDIQDQVRRLLSSTCRDYGIDVRRLAKRGPSKQRAPAVFALAFSDSADDFYLVQKYARDDSAAVRAMALAGMAARRDPDTSVELIIIVLADKKAIVRRRACEAAAACVPREHFSIDKICGDLAGLLLNDESRSVRLQAAKALGALGGPSDLKQLDKALSHELETDVRDAVKSAAKSIRQRGG